MVVVIYADMALVDPISLVRYSRDPALDPLFSLAALIGILMTIGLESRAHTAAVGLFAVCLAAATLFGGWQIQPSCGRPATAALPLGPQVEHLMQVHVREQRRRRRSLRCPRVVLGPAPVLDDACSHHPLPPIRS